MQVVNLYCGLDTNGADVDAQQIAESLAAKYFGTGHTIFNATGRYVGQVGVIDEPTIVIQVLSSSATIPADRLDHQVNNFCQDYKLLANQESVLVTWQTVEAAFIWYKPPSIIHLT